MGAGGGPSDAISPIKGPRGGFRPVQAQGRAGHPRFWPAPEETPGGTTGRQQSPGNWKGLAKGWPEVPPCFSF